MIQVRCPICERVLDPEGGTDPRCQPFCSDRCRLIDLGRWLGESYRIATDEEDDPSAGSTPETEIP